MDKELSDLRRNARKLRPALQVGRAGITEGVVQQVRQAFKNASLIKVRITAENRDAVAQAAESLAQRVPCRLVERTGFVAVLYAPALAANHAHSHSIDEAGSEVE
jgi:RNA-binding protein